MTDTTQRTKSEAFDRAVDRLRDMIAATKSPLERDIGELLTQRLLEGLPDGEAAKLLDGKKDLKGAAKALEDYARGLPRTGNCVGFGDCTALPVLLKYFGIDAGACEDPDDRPVSTVPAAPAPAAADGEGARSATSGSRFQGTPGRVAATPQSGGAADPLDLDALLGV